MNFDFSEQQKQLRKEIRDFFEEELRKGTFEMSYDAWMEGISPEFSRKMATRGWVGFTWPKEYGGQGGTYIDRLVITEEQLRYGAPIHYHLAGDRQVGPAILAYGSEEQKKEFVPRLAKAEISFALGMSEPNAGSDLASLQTQAVLENNSFVINGQKIWSTGAHYNDYCYLVARTDPNAPKHRGISEFIVDMKLPGITVRPIIDMTGTHHYNEVFFDNVRIPKTALIGEINRGWYQIASQTDYERAGMERIMGNYRVFVDIIQFVKETEYEGKYLATNPQVRHMLANLAVEFEVGRLLIYRVAWTLDIGHTPSYEAAMAKAYGTAFEQRLVNTATKLLGLYGQLLPGSKWARLKGKVARSYLYSPAFSISGGTSEILRNIVALRGASLPSG